MDMLLSKTRRAFRLLGLLVTGSLLVACVRNLPPVEPETPPPPPAHEQPPEDRQSPVVTPPEPAAPTTIREDSEFASRTLEELNRDSPLAAVFFEYDSSDLTNDARIVLDINAGVLRRYPTWLITIEGHCDERGTAEYNLGLGERRALVAREYLLTLGLDGDQIRTVSYGKEFPFDPGHTEGSWSNNRRAHFVITTH